ncbi:MAG: transporter substrate-binding domain-containing protein [Desulfobacterales bacterium]|nr:transporter substrate-binding domain-containing protein [Desulfobacterales bacterium]
MIKKTTILAFIFLMTAVVPGSAQTLTLTTGEWAPYTSESMEGKGVFTEIVTAVFNEMGKAPNYKFYPWKRCESIVGNGKAFAAFPYIITEERKAKFAFSDTVMASREMFFYFGDRLDGVEWQALEDLKPYKIGGTIGYHYEKAFNAAGLDVDYNPKEIASIKKLHAGRVDLVPVDEIVGRQLIKATFPQETGKFKMLAKPNTANDLRLMINKNDASAMAMLKEFNKALAAIKANGKYQAILEKYGLKAN